ncbi:MAG: type II secretion system protein [Selenomonadaceae bacterium]|nr:type II secretion system protein [Selenomonadaceae bacterium]
MKTEKQQGYILLEVIVLSVVVLAMAISLQLFRQAQIVMQQDSARLDGVFLAQEEFARLEWAVERDRLYEGEYGWLGDTQRLEQANGLFAVKASVQEETEEIWRARVLVNWQFAGRSGELAYERLLCRHRQQKGAGP